MTEEEKAAAALARISVLSNEIDANEEENRFMLKEIHELYAKIDAS